MFEIPHCLRLRTIWPTDWLKGEFAYPPSPLILTREEGRFVVWEYRDLFYSIQSFFYRTRWWHFFRVERLVALRQALDWVYKHNHQDDLDLVEEVVGEYEERDRQLAAIEALLNAAPK